MNKLVEIKSGSVMVVSLVLQGFDVAQIKSTLLDLTGGAGDFFDNELAIIDAANTEVKGKIEWLEIVKVAKSFGLVVVGVKNIHESQREGIAASGLSLVESVGKERESVTSPSSSVQAHPVAPKGEPMIIDTPVRAGQRIYARNTDLIVTAVVNNGAEVIADGSIHIYAELKGRALAGASGNTAARIFAQKMEPELVSVAGVYRTFENGFPSNWANKAAQVKLEKDVILIDPLQ
jgi:septum site-determining protein MinC